MPPVEVGRRGHFPEDLTDEQFQFLLTRMLKIEWTPSGPGRATIMLSASDTIKAIRVDAGLEKT